MDKNIVAVFDLETLGLTPESVLLSLGVVFFDLTKVQSFEELVSQGVNLYFDQEDQVAKGRRKDPDTLKWWEDQGPEAQLCLNNPNQFNPERLFEALNQLYKRIGFQPDRKNTRWFSRGHIDIGWIESLCRTYDIDPMIKYWCWRDVRTYLDALGIGSSNQKFIKPEGMIPHNSQHDAAFDAYMMQRLINWTPEECAAFIEQKKDK